MNMNIKNTLVVLPHLDDETFLMGGYLSKFFKKNSFFNCTVLIICGYGRGETIDNGASRLAKIIKNTKNLNVHVKCLAYKDMSLNVTDIPEISGQVKSVIDELKPAKVFIPSENDFHQDHKLVAQSCKIALRQPEKSGVKEIYECLAPYSGFNHNDTPNANTVLKLSTSEHDDKILMSERYSDTEFIPDSVYSPYEYFNLLWKRF